jgi:hypothetical protein
MTIRCGCLAPHREHEYIADQFGLCRVCSHNVAAHKPLQSEATDRLLRLLGAYELQRLTVDTDDGGRRLHLELDLVATP